ncbi:MAG TPA: hypothetical protein VNT75_03450 [Symbiobacteriaceae bacterium]|nr:hypothetical protein [Symbiobacteriaceae bacterium]
MSGILGGYTVMQQAEFAGRRFFSAQDRRTGQVVHLVAAPVSDPLEPYQHPSLPHVQSLALEGDTRWFIGAVSEGDTLEDLRAGSQLSESDLVSALLSVLDGLTSLAFLQPAPVPAYLDPACIKRDRLGRWTLDYLALAQAPEARLPASPPYGVHAFGVLLYWLVTGQTVRRSRVQLNRVEGISAALQFILIRCLGKSYPSLAELRADIERAGHEHEFRQILHKAPARSAGVLPPPRPIHLPPKTKAAETEDLLTHIPVIPPQHQEPSTRRLPEMEHHRVILGGPQIPMDDRPWALPPRPTEGYRKYVVPPPPNPLVVKAIRWGSLGLVSLATVFLAGAVIWKAGLLPGKPVARMPDYVEPGAQIGNPLPPAPNGPIAGPPVLPPEPGKQDPPPTDVVVTDPPPAEKPPSTKQPAPPSEPPKSTPPAPPKSAPAQPAQPAPTQPVPVPPPKQPAPPPEQSTPPVEAAKPARPTPEPGSPDFVDASQGGLPVMIYFNNRRMGWAYIFPHQASPYISINTFNRLFGRNLYWVPQEGGSIRLLNGNQNVITNDYNLVKDRLWLRLTPFLQEALGIQVKAYNENGMYFSSMP